VNFPPPTERQARVIWLAVAGLAVAALVGLVVAMVWALGQVVRLLSPVLWPLAIAGVIAYLLDPVVGWVQRRGASRGQAILTVFGSALVVVFALGASVVPQLVREVRDLSARIPSYASRVETRVTEWVNHPPALVGQVRNLLASDRGSRRSSGQTGGTNNTAGVSGTNDLATGGGGIAAGPGTAGDAFGRDQYRAAANWIAKTLPDVGTWVLDQLKRAASWFGVLAGLGLIPVYAFYFLLEKEGISARWTDYLPLKDSGFKQELVFVLGSINNHLIAFFRGQVLVAMCDGVLYGVGFLLIGLPYAVLIGVMAMMVTMIPFLGAILVATTALLIALAQFGDWRHPLLVLAVFGAVQALEGLVISPRIMGNRVGLHPITIIVAVMVGTTLLGGLLGGVLAIPLTAALRVAMFRYVWKKPAAE
jgi:predicted PurR-regulated permease PerM